MIYSFHKRDRMCLGQRGWFALAAAFFLLHCASIIHTSKFTGTEKHEVLSFSDVDQVIFKRLKTFAIRSLIL